MTVDVARRTFIRIISTIILSSVHGNCPHFDKDLLRWSDPRSWPGGKIPGFNDEVVLQQTLLLDVSPPDLRSIVIASGGRLVWSPAKEITLKTRYIHIFGSLEIGSESCRFAQKARIILTGRRGDYDVPGFGEKFIGVDKEGTLELHGRERLSWTKLNKTLPKLSYSHGLLYHHKDSVYKSKDSWYQGLAIYVIDINTFVKTYHVFYISGNDKWRTEEGIPGLISFLQNVPKGRVVMMAAQNCLKATADLGIIYDAFEAFAFGDVTRRSKLREVRNKDAYTMITIAGNHTSSKEKVQFRRENEDHAISVLDFTLYERRLKFTSKSVIYDINWKTYVDFSIKDIQYALPVLTLATDARSWKTGDRVLLTSTDYDYKQAEEANIIDCPTCNSNQARIDLEPKYTHWGEIIDNVDMRGEVALISRDIVIEGDMEKECPPSNENCDQYPYDTFGGQIQIMDGYANVHIEGIEVRNMGQQTSLGNYPIHFHMTGNVRGIRYTSPAYVRGNSIHHTFARCVTIHGVDGLLVSNNVCYDCLGHAFFLEDGGERWNVFDGNLGASTRKGSLIPSDQTPSTFWIVNPLTYVRNNVAAGGEHTGYWFVFPDEPIGPSRSLNLMRYSEARYTAILEVSNNVAHSNTVTGLNIDQKLLNDSSVGSVNYYEPKVDPLNSTSDNKEVVIYRMTAFKNHIQNIWIRGGAIKLERSSIADSARGLTMARTRTGEQFLCNSVVLGESPNVGEGTVYWNKTTNQAIKFPRSLHIPWDIHHPLIGFIVYDGPVYLENVWFNFFSWNKNYTASAIGFKLHNKFSSSVISSVYGLRFGFSDAEHSSIRIYDGNSSVHGFSDYDGDLEATIRDLDGSLTSYPDSQIMRPRPFFLTPDCIFRRPWNLALCQHRYIKLYVKEEETYTEYRSYQRDSKPFMVRDDIAMVSETRTGTASSEFMVILGGAYSYSLHWTKSIPRLFHITARGIDRKLSNTVRIGICLPLNSTFDLHSWTPRWLPTLADWERVPSINALDTDLVGDKYFYDAEIGVVFIKFLSEDIRHRNVTSDCPGPCPSVRVKILSGDRGNSDCRSRMYPKYLRRKKSLDQGRPVSDVGSLIHFDETLPASKGGLPQAWGAGDTLVKETYIESETHNVCPARSNVPVVTLNVLLVFLIPCLLIYI